MKKYIAIIGAGLTWLFVGCASEPVTSVALPPVGPNPLAPQSMSPGGSLEVFSRLSRRSDDGNQGSTDPIWYQHTDYNVYNLQGQLVKHVYNTVGHYEQDPKVVALPPGEYVVTAQSAGYGWIKAPVIIERGRMTRLHLDGNWAPPSYAQKAQVVTMPEGGPVGWRM
jgi:hypothetical protein